MKRSTFVSRWTGLVGGLIALLGLVQLAMSGRYIEGFPVVDLAWVDAITFLYVATGVAVVAAGVLLLSASRALRHGRKTAWRMALWVALWMLLYGVLAVIWIGSSPAAWVLLALPIVLLVPLVWFRRTFRAG